MAEAAEPIPPLGTGLVAALRARLSRTPQGVFVVGRQIGAATRIDVVAGPRAPHVDGNTVFEIGSVTKTVTAVLLAEATDRGEVRLDEPIDSLLPDGVGAPSFGGTGITLLDLATQRSGLPRLPANLDPSVADPYARYDRAALYAFLNGYTLTRAPGAAYEYSNLGFGLLGTLLADRARKPYAALTGERVFRPLGMPSTAADTALDASLVPGFDSDGGSAAPWTFDALAGAGAVRSTAREMLTYGAAFLPSGGGALGAVLRETTLPRAGAQGGRIGLAWQIDAGSGIIWHNGGTGGYRSFLGLRPDTGCVVVVLSNVFLDPSADDLALHLLDSRLPAPDGEMPQVTLAIPALERR